MAENFTTLELKFIKERTKDAPAGARLSPRQLVKLPEMKRHPRQSIATVIKEYGWADPFRSNYIKSGKRFSEYTQKKLLEFLAGQGRFWPTSLVAKRFHCRNNKISRFRKRNNLKLFHSEEAMQDPVYRSWYESKKKKRIENQQDVFRQRPALKLQMLEKKIEKFVNKVRGDLKWRACSLCKKNRPAVPDFFQRIKRKSKKTGLPYYRVTSVCSACPTNPKNKFR